VRAKKMLDKIKFVKHYIKVKRRLYMESNKKSYFTTEKDKELLKTDFLKGLDARMTKVEPDYMGEYDFKLDYYSGTHRTRGGYHISIYNIVPKGSPAPSGGYPNIRWVERVKGGKFPKKFHPANGSYTYLNY